jgi:phage tail sheath protein FI
MFHLYKRSRLLFAVLMCFTATTLGTAEAGITVPVRAPVVMADTVTAGFVGVAAQGPFDQPVLVKSYSEFEAVFGAPGVKAVDRYLANAVEAFFSNGGPQLYVVRVVDSTPSALLGDALSKTGLAALEMFDDIALIAPPGFSGMTIHNGLISHCQKMERFCLLDPTAIDSVPDVINEREQIETPSGHAGLIFPWVKFVPTGGSSEVSTPPSGLAAGVYARVTMADGVWKAPAGTTAGLIGATRLTYAVTTSDI